MEDEGLAGGCGIHLPSVGLHREGLFCYQTAQPPAACSQATTSIDATDDGGHTWRRMPRFTSKPFIGPNAVPTAWMHLFDAPVRNLRAMTPNVSTAALTPLPPPLCD
jgi:hypothetical protein